MARTLGAACAYFAMVFACAFVLGTVRTLIVAPRLGQTPAVLLEAPIVLAVSWLAAGWTIKRLNIPARAWPRLVMGAIAFALLMTVEASLSVFAFGRTVGEYLAGFATPAGAIGLIAQLGFAATPLARRIVVE